MLPIFNNCCKDVPRAAKRVWDCKKWNGVDRRIEEIEKHEANSCKQHQMLFNMGTSTVRYGSSLDQNPTPWVK